MAVCGPCVGLPVQINAFITPSCVWATEVVRNGMSDKRNQLYLLEQNLSRALKDERRRENSLLREVGELVAIRSRQDDRKWHRGRIEFVLQLLTGYKYSVVLIDHGDTVRAKPEHIRDLPMDFQSLPPQAMKLILEGIVPIKVLSSLERSSTTHMLSTSWRPAADRFVEDIRNNYESAIFIERSVKGQSHFGDLIFTMPGEGMVSLSKLLCENNHAMHSMIEFEKRQLMIPEDSHLQICPPPTIASPSTPLSCCAPSPAEAMLPSCSDASARPISFSEFKEIAKKNSKKIETLPSSKESSVSASDTDQPQKAQKLLLLSKLKKLSAPLNNATSELPQSVCDASRHLIEIPSITPKALDSAYVPAGRSITSAPAANGDKLSSRSDNKSYCANNFSEGERSTYHGKPGKLRHHMRSTKTSDSSDSSDFTSRRVCFSGRAPMEQTGPQIPFNSSDAVHSPPVESEGSSQSSNENLSPVASQPGHKQNLLKLLSKKKLCNLENPNELTDGLKESLCATISSSPNDAPQKILENELQREVVTPISFRSQKLSEENIHAEEFLARHVLRHGGFSPSPWATHSELKSKFSAHIEQLLIDRRWFYTVLTLQKFMWPAIQKRQNVVMVSPPKSGKSFSYIIPLMDFMIDSEQIPKGNGPLVLILCAGSKAVVSAYEDCVRVVNGLKKAPRVQQAYGLGVNTRDLVNLLNGCEVFITTPPCLLRILKDRRSSFAVNFKRLCHYVVDQADVLMTKFLQQIQEVHSMIVAEQVLRTNKEATPIQVIVASEKWEPRLLSFSTQVLGTPLLVINDCYEACVYGKPEVYFHLTHKSNKPTKLIQVLKDIGSLHKTVVFCDQHEVAQLETFLRNECMDVLVPSEGATVAGIDGIRLRWNSSNAGNHYILLCSDRDFDSFQITDATCVVHYSLPMQDKTYFVRRLSSILDSLPDIFESKTQTTKPTIHLLMDETNSDQLPVTVKLMQRISDKVELDTKLLQAAQAAAEMKERTTKVSKLFCKNIVMYGQCLKNHCPSRHVFIPELDDSGTLPRSGWVSMEVVYMHSAAHFSVRLIEHVSDDGDKMAWPSKYVKLGILMSKIFQNPDNRVLVASVSVGDIFAVQTVENLYQRVQVLEVLEQNKRGDPSVVSVQFLDEGKQQPMKVFMLHPLPEDLQAFPASVIDVFLCGLLPADQDDDYGHDAKLCVEKWMKNCANQGDRKAHLQAKIVCSITGALLVDSVHIMEWLPHMKTNVRRLNIKESLLAQNYALENPEHIPKLFKLCRKEESSHIVKVAKTPHVQKSLLKPDWAFLECGIFEDIHFMCAEDLQNISVFFVQKVKFQSLLKILIKDLNQAPPKQNKSNVCFEQGDFCLALYEEMWYRAQILSKNEDGSFTVFYVDYGNTGDVSIDELQGLPEWAITRLPFQAIECSLAGVSSCGIANRLRDLTGDGSKTLYAKVAESKNAFLTGGRHYVVAMVCVDFSKPNTSIINKDMLEFDGVEPCQSEMNYLNFDVDISMFYQESLSEDDESGGSKEAINQYDDLNVSDLEFRDEDLSAASETGGFDINDIDGFVNHLMEANPKLKDFVDDAGKKALCHSNSAAIEGTPQTQNMESGALGEKATGQTNNSQECLERNAEQTKNLSDWEEEGDFIGRYHLPTLCCARPPRTKWIEDLYYVWLKICLSEVDSYCLQWTHDSINFSATVSGRVFHLNQQLRGIIWPDSVQPCFKGLTIELKMKKACSGIFWSRPFATRQNFPWLSRDLEAAAAFSSDSDSVTPLESYNKEIRKLPLKLRRKSLKKEMKDKTPLPDLGSDSGGSKSDVEQIDSDEMF